MPEVIVTRGGQITLPKEIRQKLEIEEGDIVSVNVLNTAALVSKRSAAAFEIHNFLPENFDKILAEMRRSSQTERLKRLGIIP